MRVSFHRLMSLSCLLSTLFLISLTTHAQKPVKCDVKGIEKPKLKIVSAYSTEIIGVEVAIEPKFQTDENLVLMARYMKQRYCEKKSIIVLVFDNAKDAQEFSVYSVDKVSDSNRAIYSLNIDEATEKLVRIKLVDGVVTEESIPL